MYAYYGLGAAKMLPKNFPAEIITTVQILQMFGGVFIVSMGVYYRLYGGNSRSQRSQITFVLKCCFVYHIIFILILIHLISLFLPSSSCFRHLFLYLSLLLLLIFLLLLLESGEHYPIGACGNVENNLIFGGIIYTSYLYLFLEFAVKKYIFGVKDKGEKKGSKKNESEEKGSEKNDSEKKKIR